MLSLPLPPTLLLLLLLLLLPLLLPPLPLLPPPPLPPLLFSLTPVILPQKSTKVHPRPPAAHRRAQEGGANRVIGGPFVFCAPCVRK